LTQLRDDQILAVIRVIILIQDRIWEFFTIAR